MAKKTEKELEIQRLDKKTPLQMLRDYVMITVASFVYAVSVSMFLDPNSLAPGGITGIAIILNRLFGIETGTWMLLINIPEYKCRCYDNNHICQEKQCSRLEVRELQPQQLDNNVRSSRSGSGLEHPAHGYCHQGTSGQRGKQWICGHCSYRCQQVCKQ